MTHKSGAKKVCVVCDKMEVCRLYFVGKPTNISALKGPNAAVSGFGAAGVNFAIPQDKKAFSPIRIIRVSDV